MNSNKWIKLALVAIGGILIGTIIGRGLSMRRMANFSDDSARMEFRERHADCHKADAASEDAPAADADATETDADADQADCEKHGRRGGKGHGQRGGFGPGRLIGGLLRLAVVAGVVALLLKWWNKRKATPADTVSPEPDTETIEAVDAEPVVADSDTLDPDAADSDIAA